MKSLPPRIVIGLTGPIASGCSTLASLFDDPDDFDRQHGNKFLKLLINDGLVSRGIDGPTADWQVVNKTVAEKLDEYHQAKSKEDREQIFCELGRQLEKRESLNALKFLAPYYPDGKAHLFRVLSMSDIIVFRALVEIRKGRSSPYRQFDLLARPIIEHIEATMQQERMKASTIRDYYENASGENAPTELIRAFWIIHKEVRRLKRELLYHTEGKDVEILQEFGNNLRKCADPFRTLGSVGSPKENSVQLAQDMEKVINLIYKAGEAAFFVVDCLRNPYEVLYFRQRFPLFYLVSIFAEKDIRCQRRRRDLMIQGVLVCKAGMEKEVQKQFDKADELDSGEKNRDVVDGTYRQDITRCVQMSDFAINNGENHPNAQNLLHDKLLRLVSLILSPGSSKPRREEVYMNMAYAMAVKSNCICRQVGAVIAGEDGYVVGAGWNDVAHGDISCGLRPLCDLGRDIHYHIREQVEKDGRLQPRENYEEKRKSGYEQYSIDQVCFCLKDEMARNEATKNLPKALDAERSQNSDFMKGVNHTDIVKLAEKARLHRPEYCLALHAEENAVVQGSRIGGPGVRNGTIYVTAQPCTLCAKTVKQAGIVKVVYTDPYPKSEPNIFMKDVTREQFEGVKPRAYIRLFMPNHDQKEWQDLEVRNALPGLDLNTRQYLYPLG